MRLDFRLATLVTAAGVVAFVEVVPLLSERANSAYAGPGATIVAVKQDHRSSDVGSHGSGFEFVQQGPIRTIAPVF